jgi:hypothetical protein
MPTASDAEFPIRVPVRPGEIVERIGGRDLRETGHGIGP